MTEIDDEHIWTELLHVYPEYSVELQIHGYHAKNPDPDVDISFGSTYRVKMIVEYKKGVPSWDPVLKDTVLTMGTEEWIRWQFESKPYAEQFCKKLNEQKMWGPEGFNYREK